MSVHNQAIEKSRLGRLLVNRGLIGEECLSRALAESRASGQRIGEYLVTQDLISEKQLNITLRRQNRIRYVVTLLTMVIVPLQPLVGCGGSGSSGQASAPAAQSGTASAQTLSSLTITGQPSPVTVIANGTIEMFVEVSSNQAVSYQWYKDGQKLNNSTSQWLIIPNAGVNDSGHYTVVVSNADFSVSSIAANAKVISGSELSGGAGSESEAAHGEGAITAAATNFESSRITTSHAESEARQAGSVALLPTSYESARANTPSITITRQPGPVSAEQNQTLRMSVEVSSDRALNYQWYKDGRELNNGTSRFLIIPNASTNDSGSYMVVVSNSDGSVASHSVSAEVVGIMPEPEPEAEVKTEPEPEAEPEGKLEPEAEPELQPQIEPELKAEPEPKAEPEAEEKPQLDIKISLQPASASVLFAGTSHTFNVSASGSGVLQYQWRKDGVSIPDAVLSHLTIPSIKVSDAGQYDVIITNATGSITSYTTHMEVIVDRTARLSWAPPTTRVNGTVLDSSEISAYRIYHSTEDGSVEATYDILAEENSYELEDLQSGSHFFAITAIDNDGYESELSNMVSKQIAGL